MRDVLKFGLILGFFCAVSAGTLTAVYSVVSVKIEENNRIEAERKRKDVLPAAAAFERVETDGREIYVGRKGDGTAVGTAMDLSSRGYAGPIRMTLGIGIEGKISGLAISKLDQSETPGLGVKVTTEAFRSQFAGKELAQIGLRKSKKGEIDAITAATISSRAVVKGVRDGLAWYGENFPEGPPPPAAPAAAPAPEEEEINGNESGSE